MPRPAGGLAGTAALVSEEMTSVLDPGHDGIVAVVQVVRSQSGKADHRWARGVAESAG